MIKLRQIQLKPKLIGLFLCVGLLPLALMGQWSITRSTAALMEKSYAHLRTVREIKKSQIEQFFAERQGDLEVLAETVDMLRDYAVQQQTSLQDIEKTQEFLTNFVQHYEYYDAFLIQPAGQVFATVKHEPDYGTNILSGPYKDSNLGRLIAQVLETGEFGISDFEPYPPSQNEPAAFIAQPLFYQQDMQLVVALQLSLNGINRVMQQRDGLGNTGEAYLVGSDYLVRSDSFLDPEHRSVTASFANPAQGKVDTAAVHSALKGNTGEKIIRDYRGRPVLSAYTPLQVGKTTWALLAEIDNAEVEAPMKRLQRSILIAGLLTAVTAAGIAFVIIRGILKQLGADPAEVAEIARQVAAGNLRVPFETFGKSPKGMLAAMQQMVAALHHIVTDVTRAANQVVAISQTMRSGSEEVSQGASEQAASVEEVSATMEQMTTNISQNADNALQTEQIALNAATEALNSGAAVARTVTAMKEIISKISLIEEIAQQSHLLSLNATIEASKAQEYGKGFAVVAQEMRALALQAHASAVEVNKVAGKSMLAAEQAGEMLNALVPKIRKTAELVQEISASSHQQSSGITQVNQSVQQLDQVIQQNASVAEEMSATAEELTVQAERLQTTITYFRIDESLSAEHPHRTTFQEMPISAGLTPARSPVVAASF